MIRPTVTLLTDFGLQDEFVGVMKGVIWRIAPNANIADISHAVPMTLNPLLSFGKNMPR
ncbi:MAG: SAM-dependent chlorinase/fluorinase [Bellilinea sp.]